MGIRSLDCTSGEFAEVGSDFLRAGISLRFSARGASMRPLVRDGDVLFVEPVDASGISVGDVVLCRDSNGRVLVHRVIRRSKDRSNTRFLIHGDQVSRPDGWFTADQVLGRVSSFERDRVHVDMRQPALRFLGSLAVLRSRMHLVNGLFCYASPLLKHLPLFSNYLT